MKKMLLIVIMGVMVNLQKGMSQTLQETASKEQNYARDFVKKAQKSQGLLLPGITPLIKNKQTAINIAEAVLSNVYGKENIIKQRPYQVYQVDQYWVLSGTLPQGMRGGVFEIALDGKDARVIGITHGK